ncbi:hypothetical protein [Streptomyces sp. NPDC058092]|uniref:hypothetical protein n=1 Tax=Streptomyces sp. NPDC058092 TaxID=3346336 RepID=UPI0036F0F1FF
MQHPSAILPRAEGAHVRRTAVEAPRREDPLWRDSEPAGSGPHVFFAGPPHSGFDPREQVRAARDVPTDTAMAYARGSRTVTR